MKKQVRVGIVGCGKIVDFEHANAFKNSPGAEIVSLMDVKKSQIERLKKRRRLDAKGFTNFGKFLASDMDAVVISTPNSFHYEQAMAALKAGLHVLCEKPMAPTLPEANRMIAAAKRAGKILHINQSFRYLPLYRTMRDLVAEGAVGDVIHIRCIRTFTDTPDVLWSPGAKWFVSSEFQGGLNLDIGIHLADYIQWVAGDTVERIAGRLETRKKGIDVPDNVNALFEFAGGATAMLELSWTYGVDANVFEVYGTTGALRLGFTSNDRPIELIRSTKAGKRKSYPKIKKVGKTSAESFLDAVNGKAPSPTPGEVGRDALALCDAVRRSAKSGRFEKVKR